MEKYIFFLNLPYEIQDYILSYGDPDIYIKKYRMIEEFLDIVDTHKNCKKKTYIICFI